MTDQAKSPTRGPEAGLQHKRKVLIVDDDADVLQSTELLLRVMGYDAIRLADAMRIVDVAARELPDLILQDLRMPNFDLARVVNQLRENPATRGIPLVFFSADAEAATKAAQYNATAYLAKPFQHHEMEAILARAFGDPYLEERLEPAWAKPMSERAELFHRLWNELAAINNYAAVLARTTDPKSPEHAVAVELDERLLKLASLCDALQHTMPRAAAD